MMFLAGFLFGMAFTMWLLFVFARQEERRKEELTDGTL